MINFSRICLVALAALPSMASPSFGQVFVHWIPGPGVVENFNNDDNWTGSFVPEFDHGESGLIGLGGIAYLEDALLNSNSVGPAGLTVIENATMEIRTTGVLEV